MSATVDKLAGRDYLEHLVSQKAPIFLPWSKAMIHPGNGFDSRLALDNKLPWTGRTAFDRLHIATFVSEMQSATAVFRESTSSASSADSQHMSANLGVTVGSDYLNVNVTGSYDETISNTVNVRKHLSGYSFHFSEKELTSFLQGSRASRHTSYSAGVITFEQTPELTAAAREALMVNPAGFRDTYGDYFVAGLQVGANAGLCFTVHEDSHVHDTKVKLSLTVHALFCEATTEKSEEHHSMYSNLDVSFCGYNTLLEKFDQKHSSKGDSTSDLLRLVGLYASQVERLRPAVRELLAEYNLDAASPISWDQVNAICMSGLVSYVVLRPYSQLPEVARIKPRFQITEKAG